MGVRARVLRLLRDERGHSVVELLTVTVILSTILGALTLVFVTASRSQIDLDRRFQAQLHSRLALDKIRKQAHCASSASVSANRELVTFTLPSYCLSSGATAVTWCTSLVSTGRWALYTQTGTSCGTGGQKWADYLTMAALFTYFPQSATTLAKLRVDLPVNLRGPSASTGTYRLVDDIALRNSTRT